MQTICSIDPAFKKCGLVIMDSGFSVKGYENINFLANQEKKDQATYISLLWGSIKKKIDEINSKYHPDIWLIENQIGKFACVQVYSMLVSAISDLGGKIVSQSPRHKLKDSLGLEGYVDSDSNKYNQNKNKAKAIAQHFVAQTHQQVDLDRDLSDAILHAVYFIQTNLKTKLDYTHFKPRDSAPVDAKPLPAAKKTRPVRKTKKETPDVVVVQPEVQVEAQDDVVVALQPEVQLDLPVDIKPIQKNRAPRSRQVVPPPNSTPEVKEVC